MKCDGIFNNCFTADLLENLPVKNLEKSVENQQSYRNEFSVFLFLEHDV